MTLPKHNPQIDSSLKKNRKGIDVDMGYNNNHAGMHIMRYSRCTAYDDLEYYDRVAQKKYAKKKNLEKMQERCEKEPVNVKGDINMSDVKSHNQNKSKKQNPKKSTPSPPPRKYGTEKVIDFSHFLSANLVSKNIMIYALKNKKDAYKILSDAEDLLEQDMRTNAEVNSPWSWITILEKSIIFLSVVAEKLDCTIQELFINDADYCKRFVYKLLDDIDDSEWNDKEVDDKGNATITIYDFDLWHNFINRSSSSRSMDLSIERQVFDDSVNYALAYGCLIVKKSDFLVKGAYLFEEEKGKLQELVDRLIVNYPEQKE